MWPWASCVAVGKLYTAGELYAAGELYVAGQLYVAGEVLCRWRAVWQWRAVRRWAVVGCLGGAWHFMVLAQMSQWLTAGVSSRATDHLSLEGRPRIGCLPVQRPARGVTRAGRSDPLCRGY